MGAAHDEALAGGAAQGSKAYETTDAAIVAPETIGGKKVIGNTHVRVVHHLERLGHPAANLFPLLDPSSDQYKKLALSIKHNQQFEPIVLDDEDRILDGRNRLRVCIELGIEPWFKNFADLRLLNKDCKPVDAAEYAYEKNIARRDLTDDQRVMIVASYREYLDKVDRGAPKGNKNAAKKQGDQTVPAKSEPKTRAKLAKKAGVSERKAQQALNVSRKNPDLAKKVVAGKVPLSEAAKQVEPKKPKRPAPAQMGLPGLPPPSPPPHAAVGPKNGDVIAYLIASGKWEDVGDDYNRMLSRSDGDLRLYFLAVEERMSSEDWQLLSPRLALSTGRGIEINVRVTRDEALDGCRKLEVAMNRAIAALESAR